MTLSEKLLPKLSEWRPAGPGRHSFGQTFADEGWGVQLAADKTDALAALVWELALVRTGDAPAGLTLRAWAERTAARAVGLLEPLKVLEVDEVRGEALLRSAAPAKKGEQVAYYEVKLFGTARAELRRFAATRTASGRTQVAFALTHEVLAKLAGDIAG
ncbi:hypothetical protein R5W24_003572 [Gemmata sp. JC717]|uniref:hypothetical protein n=1 Tax=Gemmata algarum TaxID=2975278 RepID=UPI0021BB1317|nr:hypothetical protein [Gemmata algarum]MDY3554448.1 hypothetical protein [Gemmata algarum]